MGICTVYLSCVGLRHGSLQAKVLIKLDYWVLVFSGFFLKYEKPSHLSWDVQSYLKKQKTGEWIRERVDDASQVSLGRRQVHQMLLLKTGVVIFNNTNGTCCLQEQWLGLYWKNVDFCFGAQEVYLSLILVGRLKQQVVWVRFLFITL